MNLFFKDWFNHYTIHPSTYRLHCKLFRLVSCYTANIGHLDNYRVYAISSFFFLLYDQTSDFFHAGDTIHLFHAKVTQYEPKHFEVCSILSALHKFDRVVAIRGNASLQIELLKE